MLPTDDSATRFTPIYYFQELIVSMLTPAIDFFAAASRLCDTAAMILRFAASDSRQTSPPPLPASRSHCRQFASPPLRQPMLACRGRDAEPLIVYCRICRCRDASRRMPRFSHDYAAFCMPLRFHYADCRMPPIRFPP